MTPPSDTSGTLPDERTGPRAKDLPEGISLRGLSAADLVVLLAYHGEKSRRPCFYRDQLWLLWYEELGSSEAVLERWMGLSKKTRAWIAPGRFQPPTLGRVSAGVARASRERGPDWVLRPDREPGELYIPAEKESEILELLGGGRLSIRKIAQRVAVSRATVYRIAKRGKGAYRRAGCWFRNRLWLNWHETVEAPTFCRPGAIVKRWAALPEAARECLRAGMEPDKRGNRFQADQVAPWTVTLAVRRARRKRDGRVCSSGGSIKQRRRKWLELRESGRTWADIRKWWNTLSEGERRAIGGIRGGRKLPETHRRKGAANRRIRREVFIGRWQREIEGKPGRYGVGLYLLREIRLGGAHTSTDAAQKWDRLAEKSRRMYCPSYPAKLPPRGAGGRRFVANAISVAKAHGGEAFVAKLQARELPRKKATCRERNDLFLHLAESRCNGKGVPRQVLSICKAMPDAELQEPGVAPAQIRAVPYGRKGVNVVDAGVREAKARRDGKGHQQNRKGQATGVPGKSKQKTARKKAGGRPRKWDRLWLVIQQADAREPRPCDKDIASEFNRKYAALGLKATARVVKKVRYNYGREAIGAR